MKEEKRKATRNDCLYLRSEREVKREENENERKTAGKLRQRARSDCLYLEVDKTGKKREKEEEGTRKEGRGAGKEDRLR